MQPVPYLFFNGNCREAMTHYGVIFGNEPEIMPFEDMPDDVQAEMPGVPDDAVMHASVAIGDGMLFACDDSSGQVPEMAGSDVCIALPDEAETQRVWDALAQGGDVRMPLSAVFWTPLYGLLSDKYGVRWMIMTTSNHE
ncbi:VOC family protein [Aliiroseovarius marinus]|uniref:VOC family protein n=1 Tax=Aliiroseovarius marinus TaxID=2500159 RepID=UPI003D7C83F6